MRMAQLLWHQQKRIMKSTLLLEAKVDLESTFCITFTKTMAPAFTTTGKLSANDGSDSTDMDMIGQVRSLCEQGRLREAFHILHLMDRPFSCVEKCERLAEFWMSCRHQMWSHGLQLSALMPNMGSARMPL